MKLSSPEEQYKAAQALIVEGFGILQENSVPADSAGLISDLFIKAGGRAGEAAISETLGKKGIQHELNPSECLKEADGLIGSGIELMAKSGLPEDTARKVADLFIRAGQESFNFRLAKNK